MVDEFGRPLERSGVKHACAITDREQERVMPAHFIIGIPDVGFVLVDALAEVLDDACAFRDTAGGERTLALDLRRADGEGELTGSSEMSHGWV